MDMVQLNKANARIRELQALIRELAGALRLMIEAKEDGPFFHEDEHPPGSALHTARAAYAKAVSL